VLPQRCTPGDAAVIGFWAAAPDHCLNNLGDLGALCERSLKRDSASTRQGNATWRALHSWRARLEMQPNVRRCHEAVGLDVQPSLTLAPHVGLSLTSHFSLAILALFARNSSWKRSRQKLARVLTSLSIALLARNPTRQLPARAARCAPQRSG
jgi:hypothetical protein